MASLFDTIMTDSAIPALQAVFGVAGTHNPGAAAVTVMLAQEVVAVGEFGERMETHWTLEIPSASGAVVGQSVVVDSTTWYLRQLLADDGYLRKFAVRNTI